MSAQTYPDLLVHLGHDTEIVSYGFDDENLAIECVTCSEVLLDFDKPDEYWSDTEE